ncbi:conserved hypothetical protein [Gammaproteobacteria bacterium]
MAFAELSDSWLELVFFQVGGHSFALEADQVLSLQTLTETTQDLPDRKGTAPLSLVELLTLPSTDSYRTSTSRILEIKYQENSLLVTVEEPVVLRRCQSDTLHPFPEMVQCRLRQPAALALIILGEQLTTLLDLDKLMQERK